MTQKLQQVIGALEELLEDTTVPKNTKEKLQQAIIALKENSDESIKVDKALEELEEVADDANLQSYTRTQIWGIVSVLEKS
jgi:hypothetical protein